MINISLLSNVKYNSYCKIKNHITFDNYFTFDVTDLFFNCTYAIIKYSNYTHIQQMHADGTFTKASGYYISETKCIELIVNLLESYFKLKLEEFLARVFYAEKSKNISNFSISLNEIPVYFLTEAKNTLNSI
jgi:hypothetical protein